MWSRGSDPDNAAIPYLTAVNCFLKRYFMIDQQIAWHFVQYSESPSNSPNQTYFVITDMIRYDDKYYFCFNFAIKITIFCLLRNQKHVWFV